jgi:hypothetical protein
MRMIGLRCDVSSRCSSVSSPGPWETRIWTDSKIRDASSSEDALISNEATTSARSVSAPVSRTSASVTRRVNCPWAPMACTTSWRRM